MISILPFPIPLCFLIAGAFLVPAEVTAQGLVSGGKSERVARSESEPSILPSDLTNDYFTALKEHSPFLRTLDVSKSLILTGIARIDEEPVAAFLGNSLKCLAIRPTSRPSPQKSKLPGAPGSFRSATKNPLPP